MTQRTGREPQGFRRRPLGKLRRRRVLVAGAAAGIALMLGGAGAAYALWQSSAGVSGGTITTGDLQLTQGAGTWHQSTEGSAEDSGALSDAPPSLITMPGDTVEIHVPVTTLLRGDNLNAQLGVEVGAGANAAIAAGKISASYRVLDEDGAQVAPASGAAQIGDPVQLDGLQGTNDGVTKSWTVVVTVVVVGDYRWTAEPLLDDLDEWTLEQINVTLDQVRSGTGYLGGP